MRNHNVESFKIAEDNWLLNLYDGYFSSGTIFESFLQAISQISAELPQSINLLEIGAGTGILGQAVKKRMNENGFSVNLTIIEKQPEELEFNLDSDTTKLIGDNKNIPVQDSSQDLVIARSVTHYEENIEGLKKVLKEVKRILKPKGYYIEQRIIFSTTADQELFIKIHEFLGRKITLVSHDQYKKILFSCFRVDVSQTNTKSLECIQSSDDVAIRYNLGLSDISILRNMIEAHTKITSSEYFKLTTEGFVWRVPFLLYIIQKHE